jgi:hypothetical protein
MAVNIYSMPYRSTIEWNLKHFFPRVGLYFVAL